MNNNLSIENLSKTLNIGGMSGPDGISSASELRATQEMRNQGMDAPPSDHQNKNFLDVLKNSVEDVNMKQHEADTAIKELVAGKNKNIHETMLTIERADASLKLMMQVRNKILDAYREVMRMQV